jgi:putative endonuclease
MSSAPPASPPPSRDLARSTRTRGLAVESCVADLLDRHGLVVVARNVAIAGAEIDLVATTENTAESREPLVVFVEVRSRRDDRRGHPLETIDANKRAHIVRGATAWLVREDLWEKVAVRFDVIAVVAPDSPTPDVVWIRGAFDAGR